MDNFNSDPKPGRLILPLVLIGMIATTYTFINRVAENNNLELQTEPEVVQEEDQGYNDEPDTIPETSDKKWYEEIIEKIKIIEITKY